MAILSALQLAALRRDVATALPVVWDKPTVNTAYQNIEDWFEANRASLGAAITGGFTAPQKKQLVKAWLLQKFGRE